MPYNRLEELPTNITDPLPKAAQRLWMRAFNAAYQTCMKTGKKNVKDCEDVGRIAGWVNVKTKYKKGPNDTWVPKESK
jgi:cation transport regulator